MKIGYSSEIERHIQTGTLKKPEKESGSFRQILDKTMEGSSAADAGVAGTVGTAGTAPAAMNPAFSVMARPLVDRVENFLDTLDEYSRKLGDHRCTLREIDPLVRRMEAERDRLVPDLESLQENDELRGILDRTMIAASMEILKFDRGDYIT